MKKLIFLLSLFLMGVFFLSLKENLQALAANLGIEDSPKLNNFSRQMPARQASTGFPLSQERVSSALEIANNLLQSKKEEWKIQDYHELRPQQVNLPIGTRVTYTVFQEGVPLLNQNIQIIVSRRGKVISTENNYQALEKADLNSQSYADILKVVKDKFEVADSQKNREAVLYAVPGLNKPEIAYPLTIKSSSGPETEILVRGRDGEVLAESKARKEF